MPLIECPDCGHRVSTEALACPECGRPCVSQCSKDCVASEQTEVKESKPHARNGPSCIVTVGGGFIILCLIICVWGSITTSSGTNTDSAPPTQSSTFPGNVSASKNQRPDLTVASIDSKITESNEVWTKYAWQLKLHNDGDAPAKCDAVIEFYDKDGFVVDDDRQYGLNVSEGQSSLFTGYILVDASVADTIVKVGAKIEDD